MRFRSLASALMLIGAAAFAFPGPVQAQLLDKIKKTAENAVERETANQVDRLVTNAIRCAVDDPVCIERAEASGDDVIFVDDEGAGHHRRGRRPGHRPGGSARTGGHHLGRTGSAGGRGCIRILPLFIRGDRQTANMTASAIAAMALIAHEGMPLEDHEDHDRTQHGP